MKQFIRLRRPASNLLRAVDQQSHQSPSPSQSPFLRQLSCTRSLHSSSIRRNANEEGKPSFKGQLYQATSERLQRERLQEAEYVRQTEARRGELILLVAGVSYYLGSIGEKPLDSSSTTPLSKAPPPQHDTRTSVLQAAWTDIALIVGKEHVSTLESDLEAHSGSDWSSYKAKPNEKPFLVVYPANTEEVSKIMKVCHQRKIPVTALCGGTSLEGHFAHTRGGICLDLGRMDQIVEFHPNDLDIVVQPALGWEHLNEDLHEHGMFFPPDPGPGAKIGGMVGTGCSGTNAYRYGTMRDWVVSLTVVLADGTIIKTRRRPRKSSAGYNLTQLFIGSEGTLGIVTEATLKVAVIPKNQSVAVASFPTVHAAAECVAKVVGEGIQLAGMEILDDVQMKCINQSGSTSRQWEELPTLFFKFAGTPEGVKEQIATVQKLAKASKNKKFEFARNDDEATELWSARKEALWSVLGVKRNPDDRVWTTDVAVPISKLADIIQETKDDIAKAGILLYNEQEKEIVSDLVHRMCRRAIEMDGTVTGEHGVGLKKREYLREELGEDTLSTMRRVKQALDPLGILNPDKVIHLEAGH
ncbi:hypothetical protein B0A52_04134 [Exophiala mesophila]|uniref:FAD-binding PCMH-type domain-containing protein n=1 Tax=Exophiala mesophila TaxID=212818 RepID=A0A438NAU5_EXOME|nr:hypothetical protein B0A52_04134 [Exophiala mesophila]